jgi:hypothetical protein
MKEDRFKKLREFYQSTLTIDTDDARKMQSLARNLPGMHQMCIGQVKDQATETNNLTILLEQQHGVLYSKIIKDDSRSLSNHAITAMIESEPSFTKLKIELKEQITMLNFFEQTIINIKSTSFQLKNYVELKKFFAGD